VAEMSELDLNLTNTPTIFDGIPWNLDRRLGPSGCLNGGCESLATSPIGTRSFALDPFPFSGLDPRTQASGLPTGSYTNPTFSPGTLTNIKNRIFSYVTGTGIFNGNATLLPCATGVFPANCPQDPPLIPINPTPALNIFPPFADEDSALTTTGVPVTIDVIVNDVPMLGILDPASVKIATNPASGIAVVNLPAGTITFTPTDPLVTSASFTYTVANNFGSVSDPGTVNVTIVGPATGATIAALPASPQLPGAQITITSAGSGGSGSYEYEYWLFNGLSWTAVRPYSTTPTLTWDTTGLPAASYTIAVNVRNTGSVSPADTVAYLPYKLTTAAANVVLTANTPSPQSPGTQVTFSAAASGGSGTYEYRFLIYDGTTWTLTQNYSASPTFAWNTTGLPAGNYLVDVDVRNVGSPADRETNFYLSYVLTSPVASVGVISDQPTPHPVGTPVIFAASGVGGSGKYEYEFNLFNGVSWSLVQQYSGSSFWTLPGSTVAGDYVIGVNVRNAGTSNASDAVIFVPYVVQ